MTRTLLIDNYDSFTSNLYHLILAVNGCAPTVIPNDTRDWHPDILQQFDNIVISPGPGRPDHDRDFGICRDAILQNIVPVLGICLGHQGICHLHGGHVDLAIHARHGRYSRITHDGTGLFEHIPSPFTAVRYHSLAVDRLPETLVATAHAEDGTIMAVSHRTLPQWGVQFHPESIGTAFGHRIFENFDTLTKEWNRRHDRSPFVASPPKPAISARSICRERTSLVLHHRRLSYELDSEYLFDTCFRHHPHAIWLDSNRNGYGSGRFSFMGCAGGTLGRIAKADIATRSIQITDSSGTHTVRHSLFEWLEEDLAKKRIPRDGIDIPFEFTLGWMGYIGYEMKADGTEEHPHPSPYPDAILLFCDRGIVIDHQEKQIHLLALSEKNVTGNAVKWLDDMANRFRSFRPDDSHLPDLPSHLPIKAPFRLRHDKQTYIDLIRKSQEYIRQGDTYEVCLTNTAVGHTDADPWTAYRILRRNNPSPYGAYLQLGDLYILSCSPERFLKISGDRIAESKPIKGTRPRSADPEKDRQLYESLVSSEKELAENLMIVDLVRHDLGLTATPGSVKVPKLFAIESYQTVHQLVSTITSTIREDSSPCQCIRAAFPGGSMTGAPKLRTMQILDSLEGGARGIYSGVIGYFSLCGAVDLSIVIRTLVMSHGTMTFGVGGAITALSTPEEEFEETRIKAKAFLDLFQTGFADDTSTP